MNHKNSRQRRRRPSSRLRAAMTASRGKAFLLCAVLLGTVAGCATPAPELGADTAKELQAQVLAITQAAAAEDPAGSLKLLDELGIKLDQAAAAGGVSFTRHQSIRTAIDAVRADLTAQQAAADAARAAEQAAAEQAAAEQAAAEQAAAEQAAAPAPPPVVVAPAPAPADNGPDKGKGPDGGKDQDVGKDQDKGKGSQKD